MSTKRKNTSAHPAEKGEEATPARVVAIPKDQEPPAAATAPAPAKPAVKSKSERIGDTLRQARLEREDDLYQIAEYLCIKPAFLIALESSHYDELPADAYVIGFLRTYANFLGVDGKEAVDRYRYEMAGRRKKPVLQMPTPVSEGRAPSGLIMVAAAFVILLIYALWYGLSSSNRAEVHVSPPLPTTTQQVPAIPSDASAGLTSPVTTSSGPAPSQATPIPSGSSSTAIIPPAAPGIMVTAAQSPAAAAAEAASKLGNLPPALPSTDDKAAAAAGKPMSLTPDTAPKDAPKDATAKDATAKDTNAKSADKSADKTDDKPAAKDDKNTGKQVYGDPDTVSHLIIRATQSSWVMVTDDNGKAVFDHVLKPGDVYKVPNKSGLKLTTGNGTGIVLLLDGNELPKVATGAPHVVRNIPLDPDKLSSDSSDR